MPLATHASLTLARFNTLQTSGPIDAGVLPEALFLMAGADSRAAACEAKSQQAFKFAILGLHESAESAQLALKHRLSIAPWITDAIETWSAVLKPFRHHGAANYLNSENPGPLFQEMDLVPPERTPILVITTAGWVNTEGENLARIREFGAGVGGVRISMTGIAGLHSQQSFYLPGGVQLDGFTVTLWRDFAATRDFAYGPGTHRHMMKRMQDENQWDRTSFTRFTIAQSEGSWHGSDPTDW